jgi:hypothetical protein
MRNRKAIGIHGNNAELLKYDKGYFYNALSAVNVCCDALKNLGIKSM